MDYKTARSFLIDQASITEMGQPDTFLLRLQEGKPPIPGQVTSILLALKVVFDGLKDAAALDRQLVYALYVLGFDSRQLFDRGEQTGVTWPPLLDEDITRIATAVRSIFSGTWQA